MAMNRETIGLLDGVLPTKAAGYQDVRQVAGVALMMEIVWKSPEEKLAIGLIYCQNPVFLGFLFGKQFQVFLKGRSGDVIPKGQVMSSQKVVWYWVNLPEFSPLLFAIHCSNRSQSLSQSSPSSKVLPATASPYSGRSGVALATPSAPCSPCYTAGGAVVYSRGKRFGWSMATWQDQVLNKKVSLQ